MSNHQKTAAKRGAAIISLEDASRESIGRRVYKLLREQILCLELAPSAELDEVQISSDFGFSRTPVREALIRLAADGLVVLAPNRGARVAPIDIDRIPQVLEALELFERVTARWAAQRHKPEHISMLERRNREFAEACAEGNARLIVETNWKFHDGINQACGNEYFAADCSKMLRSVMRLSLLAFRREHSDAPNYDDVIRQHEELITAIRQRDANAAEQIIYDHSDNFRERMKEFVAGRSTSDISL
jgi:DNA-binding GntR family transcriptional regulator